MNKPSTPELNALISKPPVKWVGGKRQLLSELIPLMPESFNQYFEPFFGGGALFFALKPSPATLTDLNPELINLYKVIRDKPNKLIKHLSTHVNDSDYYYEIRLLDRDEEVFSSLTDVERASRFMYLNKTGYNGLWRVNSKGQNNVPFGRYTNPNILDSENIKACAIALKHSEIRCTDFTYVKNKVGEGDFVYFDPPYYPVNETSNFTNYTKLGFGEDMQVRLKELCDYIHNVGAYFMLSNSYTPTILKLYDSKEYNHTEVHASRAINCKATGRGKIKELVIRNY